MKTILFFAALFVATASFSQAGSAVKVPEITLKDTAGNEVKLSSLKGKVVIIDFWASWCGPCRQANKTLKEVYSKYKNKGLEILSISVDENPLMWKKAITQDKTTWLHVIDEKNYAYAWKISSIPTTFIIDKEGNFAAVDPEIKDIDKLVAKLL